MLLSITSLGIRFYSGEMSEDEYVAKVKLMMVMQTCLDEKRQREDGEIIPQTVLDKY